MTADNHRSTQPSPAGQPQSAVGLRALAPGFPVGSGVAAAARQDAAEILHNADEDDDVFDKAGNKVKKATEKLKEELGSLID